MLLRRGISTFLIIPVVHGILIPVIDFLLECPRWPSVPAHHPTLLPLPELEIAIAIPRNGVELPLRPPPRQHPLMIPRTQGQTRETPHYVCDDVEEVKVAPIGEQALQELGADAEDEGADGEGEVEGAAAVGVDYPIEDYREQEEGHEMEELVVDVGAGLDGAKAGVSGDEEQEEEDP